MIHAGTSDLAAIAAEGTKPLVATAVQKFQEIIDQDLFPEEESMPPAGRSSRQRVSLGVVEAFLKGRVVDPARLTVIT